MTDPTPQRRVVRPFPDDDPLCYEELTGEGLALRALLAVLADTGAAVEFPPGLLPHPTGLLMAEGWRLRHTQDPGSAPGTVVVAAQWVDLPEFARPPEDQKSPPEC